MVRAHRSERSFRGRDDLDVHRLELGRELELLQPLDEIAVDGLGGVGFFPHERELHLPGVLLDRGLAPRFESIVQLTSPGHRRAVLARHGSPRLGHFALEPGLRVGEVGRELLHLRMLRSVHRARPRDLPLEPRQVGLQRFDQVAADRGGDRVRIRGLVELSLPGLLLDAVVLGIRVSRALLVELMEHEVETAVGIRDDLVLLDELLDVPGGVLAAASEVHELSLQPLRRGVGRLPSLLGRGLDVLARDAIGDGGRETRIGDAGGDPHDPASLHGRHVDVPFEPGEDARVRRGGGGRRRRPYQVHCRVKDRPAVPGVGERRMSLEPESRFDPGQQRAAREPFVLRAVVGVEHPLVESDVVLCRERRVADRHDPRSFRVDLERQRPLVHRRRREAPRRDERHDGRRESEDQPAVVDDDIPGGSEPSSARRRGIGRLGVYDFRDGRDHPGR